MIDAQGVQDFERGWATILDALDKLRALPAPTESEGLRAFAKWHDETKKIIAQIPRLEDAEQLSEFAESVERALSELEGKVGGAGVLEKPYPRDDGMLIAHTIHEVEYAQGTAFVDREGDPWDATQGYPLFMEAHPCDNNGENMDEEVTLTLMLPPMVMRRSFLIQNPSWDKVVAYVIGRGLPWYGVPPGVNIDGHVIAGMLVDKDLPILSATTGSPNESPQLLLWHSNVEPDTHYGYKTGWAIDALFAGRFMVGRDSEDEDFLAVGPGGGAKTHAHPIDTSPEQTSEIDYGSQFRASSPSHKHGGTTSDAPGTTGMPPYTVTNVIKWVGLT